MALKLNSKIHTKKFLHLLCSSRVSEPRHHFSRFIQTNVKVTSTSALLTSDNTLRSYNRCGVFSRDVTSCLKPLVPQIDVLKRSYSKKYDDDLDEEEMMREHADVHFPISHSLPAAVVVPENWPEVPLIPISRNPLFPRFIKLLEVRFFGAHKSIRVTIFSNSLFFSL